MIAYGSAIRGDGKIALADSHGGGIASYRVEELLDFLLSPYDVPLNRPSFRVVWDIDEMAAPILSLLDSERLAVLWQTGRTWLFPYSITYNEGKSLTVKQGGWRATYFHLSQFYIDEPVPKNLQVVEALARNLMIELKALGLEPTRLSSPTALFDRLLESMYLPTWEDGVPDGANQMAWDCTGRPWTEAFKIGWFEEAFDYDICSSFPSEMALLLDTRRGSWHEEKKFPSWAVYGFAYGKVKITADVSPISMVDTAGHVYFPKGSWHTTLSLQEIRFIEEFNLGSFTPTEGYFWVPEKRNKPLYRTMHELYGNRLEDVSTHLQKTLKRAMASLYGRMLQTYNDGSFGPFVNLVWAAVVENNIKLKVARLIMENKLQPHLIHTSTDGCLLDKCLNEDEIRLGNGNMGEWRLDSSGPALVVSAGNLFYGDKRPHQLLYVEAMYLISRDPDNASWDKRITRRMTLGDRVVSKQDIGKVREVTTGFAIPPEQSREYSKLPHTGRELTRNVYDSTALGTGKLRGGKRTARLKQYEEKKPQ